MGFLDDEFTYEVCFRTNRLSSRAGLSLERPDDSIGVGFSLKTNNIFFQDADFRFGEQPPSTVVFKSGIGENAFAYPPEQVVFANAYRSADFGGAVKSLVVYGDSHMHILYSTIPNYTFGYPGQQSPNRANACFNLYNESTGFL
jgi:hypothetical protein